MGPRRKVQPDDKESPQSASKTKPKKIQADDQESSQSPSKPKAKARKPKEKSTEIKQNTATEAQILNSKKKNPTGIYVVEPGASTFDTPNPVTVGYLHLKSTLDFWALMTPGEAIFDSLQAFQLDNRAYGFHCTPQLKATADVEETDEAPKHIVSVKAKSIFDLIADEDSALAALLDQRLPLPSDTDALNSKSTTRAIWSYVVQMHQNMTHAPQLFDEGQDSTEGQDEDLSPAAVIKLGHSMEDWNRSYILIRTHQKSFHNASRAGNPEGNKHEKPAQIPAFLTEDDLKGLSISADKQFSAVGDDPRWRKITANAGDTDYMLLEGLESDEDPEESDEQRQKRKDDAFLTLEAQLHSDVKTRTAQGRPLMSLPELTAHLERIGDRCSVKYEESAKAGPSESVRSLTDKSLVESEAFNNETEKDQNREEFWARNGELNKVYALRTGYMTACKMLKIEPEKPILKNTNAKLKPWQPEAVAFMHMMEHSRIRSSIIADDVGLGKTVSALSHIANEHTHCVARIAAGEKIDCKPTLILHPSTASTIWKSELRGKFPNLKFTLFQGGKATAADEDIELTLGTKAEDLVEFLDSLNPQDPDTAATVVLTSITTGVKRLLSWETSAYQIKKGKSKATSTKVAVDDDDNDEQENDEVDDRIIESIELFDGVAGRFSRIIIDEAHKLKSLKTMGYQLAKRIGGPKILLTATPIINRPIDLHGLLSLIWLPEWEEPDQKVLKLEQYKQADEEIQQALSIDNLAQKAGDFAWVLHPDSYYIHAGGHGQVQMPAHVAATVLPPILRLIQFRRVKADYVEDYLDGERMVIGSDLKGFRILTAELLPTHTQKLMNMQLNAELLPNLVKGADAETKEGFLNGTVCQHLARASLHPYAERIYKRGGKTTLKILETWYDSDDSGATFWFESTKIDASYPVPRDRATLSWIIAYDSPKLQFLARLVKQVCFDQGSKLLIFVDWPFNLWLVNTFLQGAFGIECLVIRSGQSAAERVKTEKKFNDKRHPVKCLIASIRVSAISSNLQAQCSDVVLLDVPPNANTKMQCLDKLYRVGQEEEVTMWVPTLNLPAPSHKRPTTPMAEEEQPDQKRAKSGEDEETDVEKCLSKVDC